MCFVLDYMFYGQMETLQLLLQVIYFIILVNVIMSALINMYLNNSKQDFYKKVHNCLMISTVIPIIFYFVKHQNDTARNILSFLNPNQLAIYALLGMSMLFYLTLFARECDLKVNKVASLCLLNVYLLYFILSASRAAFSIVLLYIVTYFILFKIKQFRRHPVVCMVLISLLISLPCWLLFNDMLSHFESIREANAFDINTLQNEVSVRMLQGASYDFSKISYFLFGVGQASNPLRPQHLEFHNNFMGIMNQVGIIGFILYVIFNISIIRTLLKYGALYILPYACYIEVSFFHYLFRERINWCFLAVLILMTIYRKLDTLKVIENHEISSPAIETVS